MSGVRPELVRSRKYEITRRVVIVDVPPLDNGAGNTIQVFSADYAEPNGDMSDPPRMSLPMTQLTREQWEEVKRLGDEAWRRFEADHMGGRP